MGGLRRTQTHSRAYPLIIKQSWSDPHISARARAQTDGCETTHNQTGSCKDSNIPRSTRAQTRFAVHVAEGKSKGNRHFLAACNGSIKMVLRKPQTKSAFSGGWKWNRRIFSEEFPREIAISPVAKEILRLLRKATGEFFWRKYGPESRILRSLPIWRL